MARNKWLKREPKHLPRLSRQTIPKHLVFFDTETHVIEDDGGGVSFPLRLGVANYVRLNFDGSIKGDETIVFYSTDEFFEFLLDKQRSKQKMWVFAHNVGFDVRVLDLPTYVNDRDFKSEPPIINDRVFIWDVKTGKATITFMDTANYGVHSVSQLGSDMGYDKLDIDFDTDNIDELITYCKRDVEILRRFVLSYITFIQENNLGEVRVTIASQAFTTYRYKFMHKQPMIHINEDVLRLERSGYYGGRTECFFIGTLEGETHYYVDVNSMYPYVMLTKKIPHTLIGHSRNVPVRYLGVRLSKFYVVAKVRLNTDKIIYPYRRGKRLIFPVGRFITTLHHSELELAYKHGHIEHVYECAIYEHDYLFSDYVRFFYDLKQRYGREGKKTWRLITKLFLNSLYGKFGQIQPTRKLLLVDKGDEIIRIPNLTEEDLLQLDHIYTSEMFRITGSHKESNRHFQLLMWYGSLYEESREGETLYSCPSIAGSVTAYARIRLWEIMSLAGLDNVYYIDTDSCIVNQDGYNNLAPMLNENEIGMLALEDTTERVVIHGNKDYEFGDTVRHKGLPKTAVQTKQDTWEYVQFQGFISWLNEGGKPGMIGHRRQKRRLHTYDKGIVDPKTGYIKPHHL